MLPTKDKTKVIDHDRSTRDPLLPTKQYTIHVKDSQMHKTYAYRGLMIVATRKASRQRETPLARTYE